jgi:hypothetical protein
LSVTTYQEDIHDWSLRNTKKFRNGKGGEEAVSRVFMFGADVAFYTTILRTIAERTNTDTCT